MVQGEGLRRSVRTGENGIPIGNADEFGKPIGSDKDEGKVTYVDLLGLDDCGKLVHELTEQAVSTVSDLDQDGFLTALAESLTERTK